MVFPRHDQYVGRSLAQYGEYSKSECALFAQVLHPGDTAVDVGANIGCHSLHFARRVGSGGSVIALEPQRVLFHMLCANMVLNEQFHVRAVHAAAGAQPGSLRVPQLDYARADNFGALALGGRQTGESVGMITLDALELDALHLIKIDVEAWRRR